VIPGDFLLLLRFGEDDPEIYWQRSLEQATRRASELIAQRGRCPWLALVLEKDSCPARGKFAVIARRREDGTWN